MDWSTVAQEATIALLPVLVAAVTALIGLGFAYLRKRFVWMERTKTDEQIENSLKSIVVELNQTYVDELKKVRGGKLTEEDKDYIRRQALLKLEMQLTAEQRKVLEALTDDVSAYLTSKLERLVTEAKIDQAIAKNSQAPAGS